MSLLIPTLFCSIGGCMKFKCKLSGCVYEYTAQVDIDTMLTHDGYEQVVAVVKPKVVPKTED